MDMLCGYSQIVQDSNNLVGVDFNNLKALLQVCECFDGCS